MNKTTNKHLFIVLLLLATLLTTGCSKEEKTTPKPPPPQVTVAQPTVQDITNYTYFTGYTQARKSIEIRARVEGFLESISFTPGSMVNKEDLLFTIDRRSFAAQVSQAEASVASSQAKLNLAKAAMKRKESAYKQRAVSELNVLEAKAQAEEAKAALEGAEAVLVNAWLELSYTEIVAPINGRISRNLVDAGNLVGSGGDKTLLATMVNYAPIHVYFYIDERSLLLFKRHNREKQKKKFRDKNIPVFLALEGDTGYPHEGHIDYLDNTVDTSTGTIEARAIFDNKDLFILPGLFARIRIPYQEVRNGLLVPDEALGVDQRGRYLLCVNKKNIVEYKPVEIGAVIDGLRVITKGITADDRVIVKGIQRARPGSVVDPVAAKLSTEASAEASTKKSIPAPEKPAEESK